MPYQDPLSSLFSGLTQGFQYGQQRADMRRQEAQQQADRQTAESWRAVEWARQQQQDALARPGAEAYNAKMALDLAETQRKAALRNTRLGDTPFGLARLQGIREDLREKAAALTHEQFDLVEDDIPKAQTQGQKDQEAATALQLKHAQYLEQQRTLQPEALKAGLAAIGPKPVPPVRSLLPQEPMGFLPPGAPPQAPYADQFGAPWMQLPTSTPMPDRVDFPQADLTRLDPNKPDTWLVEGMKAEQATAARFQAFVRAQVDQGLSLEAATAQAKAYLGPEMEQVGQAVDLAKALAAAQRANNPGDRTLAEMAAGAGASPPMADSGPVTGLSPGLVVPGPGGVPVVRTNQPPPSAPRAPGGPQPPRFNAPPPATPGSSLLPPGVDPGKLTFDQFLKLTQEEGRRNPSITPVEKERLRLDWTKFKDSRSRWEAEQAIAKARLKLEAIRTNADWIRAQKTGKGGKAPAPKISVNKESGAASEIAVKAYRSGFTHPWDNLDALDKAWAKANPNMEGPVKAKVLSQGFVSAYLDPPPALQGQLNALQVQGIPKRFSAPALRSIYADLYFAGTPKDKIDFEASKALSTWAVSEEGNKALKVAGVDPKGKQN